VGNHREQRFLRSRAGIRAVVVAVALFFTYAFFYQAGGWNQNSRFDLVRAVVEERTFRIDDYHTNTGDKALIDGHYYSDKAPGLALISIPPVALARPVLDAVGIDSTGPKALTLLTYLVTLLGVALPTALAAFGIFWLARRLGAGSAGATFAAVAFGIATPIWAYATLFWSHALTAALLFGGFAAAVSLRDRGSPRRDVLLGALVGLSVGWAVVSEFTAAIPAVLIAALAAKHVWVDRPDAPRVRVLVAMVGGALVCGIVLLAHNALAYGAPFELGYSHEVNFPQQNEGFFGVSVPDLSVLGEILFGRYRGLLYLAPVVAAAPIGLYLLAKKRELWATVAVAALIPAYYLLVNAGYATWDGGWTYGPRFLAPAIPFLCFPLAFVWTRARVLLRLPLVALVLWGGALSLVAESTTVQPPDYYKEPVTQLLWPSFRDSRFSLNTLTFDEYGNEGPPLLSVEDGNDRAAWNVGERLGIAGHASLVPLFLLWAAAAAAWWLVGRRRAARSPRAPGPQVSAEAVPGPPATPVPAAPPGPREGAP
jgi:hypothetical protein